MIYQSTFRTESDVSVRFLFVVENMMVLRSVLGCFVEASSRPQGLVFGRGVIVALVIQVLCVLARQYDPDSATSTPGLS